MTYTDEQLAQLAKLLGYSSIRGGMVTYVVTTSDGEEFSCTDGDLLLAILNRCAELGYRPTLEAICAMGRTLWACRIFSNHASFIYGCTDTLLEATILAVLQLPEAKP